MIQQTIPAYIYIYHLGVKFNLPTLPDTLTDTMNINFEQTSVLARSAPQITFSSAGPRSINITISLHRHAFALENPELDKQTQKKYIMLPDPLTGAETKVEVTDAADLLINALSALSLPKYTDTTKAIVPPSLLIRYGSELAIRGVPSQVTKTSTGPWLKNNKMAQVSINFTVTETEPFSAQYVAQNGALRGLSTTLERSSVWQY